MKWPGKRHVLAGIVSGFPHSVWYVATLGIGIVLLNVEMFEETRVIAVSFLVPNGGFGAR